MYTFLLTDNDDIVRATMESSIENPETLTIKKFPGDANPIYNDTRTWDGVELIEIPKKIITTEEFINQFTASELRQILQSESADAKIILLMFDKSSEINLDDEKIVGSITNLTNLGVFTEDRKKQILK